MTEEVEISLLDGVPRAFPALVRAQKIQKKAAKVGFDWESARDVVEKVREELAEVEEEFNGVPSKERLAEEMGDLLFAVVNLARVLSLDAESSLQAATDKFSRRFQSMEREIPKESSFVDLSFDAMNALWDQVKRDEVAGKTSL